jgi:hypothetical protein
MRVAQHRTMTAHCSSYTLSGRKCFRIRNGSPSLYKKEHTVLRILFVYLLAFLIFRCTSPRPEPGPDPSSSKKLVRIDVEGDSLSSLIFTYQPSGDIQRLIFGTDTIDYLYGADTMICSLRDRQGIVFATQKYRSAPSGRILSQDAFDRNGYLYTTMIHTYDQAGYLIAQQRVNERTQDTFAMQYHYANGNLQHIDITRNGEHIDRFGYLYDQSLPNMLDLNLEYIFYDYFARHRMGTVNTHLVRKMYRLNPAGDTTAVRYSMYEVDPEGYIRIRRDATDPTLFSLPLAGLDDGLTTRKYHYDR